MIANFFNKTKPVTIFSLVVLLFIFYLSSSLMLNTEEFSIYNFLKMILFFGWHILFLMIVNFIVKKNKLTQDNSYALLLIVLMLSTFREAFLSTNIVFSNLILLLSYRRIYSLKSEINTSAKLFDAGLWIGVSSLIYSWSIFFIVLVYASIFIYKKINLKNSLIPLVGLITPLFLFFTYVFCFDNEIVFYDRFKYDLNLVFTSYNALHLLLPITFIVTILLWSVFSVTPKLVLVGNKLKLSWQVIINHLLIALTIIVLSPIKNGSEFYFLLFPLGVIFANFLQISSSKTFKNMVLYLFLLVSISSYFL